MSCTITADSLLAEDPVVSEQHPPNKSPHVYFIGIDWHDTRYGTTLSVRCEAVYCNAIQIWQT